MRGRSSGTCARRSWMKTISSFGCGASATRRWPARRSRFNLRVDGTPKPCSEDVREQLLRIGQEAILNAVRHAHASLITMQLDYGGDTISLRVTDDGRGFSYDEVALEAGRHYGLTQHARARRSFRRSLSHFEPGWPGHDHRSGRCRRGLAGEGPMPMPTSSRFEFCASRITVLSARASRSSSAGSRI